MLHHTLLRGHQSSQHELSRLSAMICLLQPIRSLVDRISLFLDHPLWRHIAYLRRGPSNSFNCTCMTSPFLTTATYSTILFINDKYTVMIAFLNYSDFYFLHSLYIHICLLSVLSLWFFSLFWSFHRILIYTHFTLRSYSYTHTSMHTH